MRIGIPEKLMTRIRPHISAVVIFVWGCALSAGIASYSRQVSDRIDGLRFNGETRLASRFIEARLERYVNALIHTKALFAVDKNIGRKQFRRYIDDLDVLQKYPGTLGIGYAIRNQSRFIVEAVEPPGPFARGITGRDLEAAAPRSDAIASAVSSGQPTLSQRISIGQGGVGFLMVNPVFSRGRPTETAEQRESAAVGVVFSAFDAKSFFDDVFRENPIDSSIGIRVYDDEHTSPRGLLFQRYLGNPSLQHPHFELMRTIQVAGRIWSVDFRALPSFQSQWASRVPEIFFAIGVLISYLLAQIIWSMQSRIATERQLVERVRRAIGMRDEFISIASHELKTPITSLKLQLALAAKYPDRAAQMIESSAKQTNRLNRLIDELLDMTRIQAGRMKYDFERTDLSALVREITGRYKEALLEAGCEIHLIADMKVEADVDRFRLEQVLVNLLSNAMKYARGKPVDVWVERQGTDAMIRVADHGPGIPPEKQNLIFTRFERLSEDRGISGLGLGLYISRQIVEAHGGRIRVQSDMGQGSTFIIELPLRHSDEPS